MGFGLKVAVAVGPTVAGPVVGVTVARSAGLATGEISGGVAVGVATVSARTAVDEMAGVAGVEPGEGLADSSETSLRPPKALSTKLEIRT